MFGSLPPGLIDIFLEPSHLPFFFRPGGRTFARPLETEVEKKPCLAPISRLRVEKIEGGIVVAGVVVAANCQLALPIFGCLFELVGIVLTVASYRGPGQDEEPENYAARLAFTGNSRTLGPACIAVGCIMLSAGIFLCLLAKKARRRERRVGFHCPIHGNFYPLSPATGCASLGKRSSNWKLCFGRTRNAAAEDVSHSLPQCPHTQLSSTRSSFSVPMSPCPTPMPFLVTSSSIGSDLVITVGGNASPDQTFGSIRSLSVCREVASFPLSRTPSPPHQESLPEGTTEKHAEDPGTEEDNFMVPIGETKLTISEGEMVHPKGPVTSRLVLSASVTSRERSVPNDDGEEDQNFVFRPAKACGFGPDVGAPKEDIVRDLWYRELTS